MTAAPDLDQDDPFALWQAWLAEAERTEPNDPNAAALATSTPDGHPSVRMVLVKAVQSGAFRFFTNAESEKGGQLEVNSHAALCFHWKSLRRQVRVEGSVTDVSGAEVDTYFHSRSRRSQIGAAVSQQSRPLQSRELLEQQVAAFEGEHPEEVPRPAFWRGYDVHAERLEFWSDGPDRLHNRMLFTSQEGRWQHGRLYP